MVEILDNSSHRKVSDAIKDLIVDAEQASIAVGYFYANGWDLIKDDLPEAPPENFMKILIGQELDYNTFSEIKKGYKLRQTTQILDDLSEITDKEVEKLR